MAAQIVLVIIIGTVFLVRVVVAVHGARADAGAAEAYRQRQAAEFDARGRSVE